jgi:hypothetical protein
MVIILNTKFLFTDYIFLNLIIEDIEEIINEVNCKEKFKCEGFSVTTLFSDGSKESRLFTF